MNESAGQSNTRRSRTVGSNQHSAVAGYDRVAARFGVRFAGSPSRQCAERIDLRLPPARRAESLEEALGLHWTWIAEALRTEPKPLAVLVASALRTPDKEKIVAQIDPRGEARLSTDTSLGARVRMARFLRRWLLSSFQLVDLAALDDETASNLLSLTPDGLHLLLENVGADAVARLAYAEDREAVSARLRALPAIDAIRLRRLLERRAPDKSSNSTTAHTLPGDTVLELLNVAASVPDSGWGVIGLLGLAQIAMGVSRVPRCTAVMLAQRLPVRYGMRLLLWRDSFGDDKCALDQGALTAVRASIDRASTLVLRTRRPDNVRGSVLEN